VNIVVIGGSEPIGSKLGALLRHRGEQVREVSVERGVNTLTGNGLAEALAGAHAVIDVANFSPAPRPDSVSSFETSNLSLLRAEVAAGVKHHVALSFVGADRLQEGDYFRAKIIQEMLIKSSGIPYTILRSTQLFEFVDQIADSFGDGSAVRLSAALVQPILSDDVAHALADIVMSSPANDMIEVAGPERFQLDDLVRHLLSARRDPRRVITDARARYFGAKIEDESLLPDKPPLVFGTRFETWLGRTTRI